MAEQFDVTVVRNRASGDQLSDAIDEAADRFGRNGEPTANPLDSEEAKNTHRRLLEWLYLERDKQAENRHQMALDADFYDNIQWDPDDAETLRARGQMPLVFNEVAPMCDWLIGTERRTRIDWRVLPRTEDDVQLADVKTKVLKYVSDVNRVVFARSRAFADAVKCGVGWVDDGVRDDPTKDVLYSRYEDWRNVLWDSSAYELDIDDGRYVFRWRWVDEDVAKAMFPGREAQIEAAMQDTGNLDQTFDDDDAAGWYDPSRNEPSGTLTAGGMGGMMVDSKRRRIKIYEAQFKMPVKVRIVGDGPLRGSFVSQFDPTIQQHIESQGCGIIEKVAMRVHFACFTERDMLALGPSIYRHNRFTLTPIWCYRRSRDRLPYGMIRRVRDIQQDLNKRASKALFALNTNQVIVEEGAVEDLNVLRDEADQPDGMLVVKNGKLGAIQIHRDSEMASGQVNLMTMDAQAIQRGTGVSNENLGRQTNAQSGVAIEARQLSGSVVTTEPFDNLRYANQVQGEKQTSLVEQFYSEEKVIRLTGERGKIEWLRINQPEVQPDGSIRYLNDVTASQGDFVVSEQDYAGSLRQVMFEQLMNLAAKLPPEISLKLLRMAMENSDLPNKDAIADEIRKITGERDPDKPMTPEEQAQAEQQMQMQQEALQMQRQSAMTALAEQQAKVRKLNAEAAKLEGEAGQADGMDPGVAQELMKIRQQQQDEIDRMSEELRKAQFELANRTLQIQRDADTKLEVARIDADTKLRIAEIQEASDQRIAALQARMDALLAANDAHLAEKDAEHAAEIARLEQKAAEKAAPATESKAK